jgi:hypothetical protein
MNKLKELLNRSFEIPKLDFSRFDPAVSKSIEYLSSPAALASIEADPYWPKWDAPWWHMSVLFEMGLADKIPKKTAKQLLDEVAATHLPYFFKAEAPKNKTAKQDAPCPCAFGNIYQILNATGLDVDAALPWARGWFVKYQMGDGGLSCDEGAYHADAKASSMVGTISPLEAMLSVSELTSAEENFLNLGAKCMLDRKLMLGSISQFNAEEKLDEADWIKPCFPRLYFYDVIRGLNFIVRWSERLKRPIPELSITPVIEQIFNKFPNGKILIERHSYEDVGTKKMDIDGKWERGFSATRFALLSEVSAIGSESPFLTKCWNETLILLSSLQKDGLIAEGGHSDL